MSFTRKSIADHLDSYDTEISELQNSKREMLADYRDQLAQAGMGKAGIKAEVEALKAAMRRRRAIAKKGSEEVEQADALADEIFVEITSRAPRATRTREEQPETAKETQETPAPEQMDAKGGTGANAGGGDVDRSATRASSAVEVGATNSPDGATISDPGLGHAPDCSSLAAREADESAATNSQSADTLPADKPEAAPDPQPQASGTLSDEDVPLFLKREVAA